jgi:hypothetical protein
LIIKQAGLSTWREETWIFLEEGDGYNDFASILQNHMNE